MSAGVLKAGGVKLAEVPGAILRDSRTGEVMIVGDVPLEDVGRFVLDGVRREPLSSPPPSSPR